MIKYINTSTDGCTALGAIKACLDYPACGYHSDDEITISGWVLPPITSRKDTQVIVKINSENQHRKFTTERVSRPDVFKAILPNADFSTEDMHVGFFIKVPFIKNSTASIIILYEGVEYLWCKIDITISHSITLFVESINNCTQENIDDIKKEEITSSVKFYDSETIEYSHKSVIHQHLKKIKNAVACDEFLISLYNSKHGHVLNEKDLVDFQICNSKSIEDHVFLFCRDKTGLDFIIYQYVTSIDGIYYPSSGIYYVFCHNSQYRLNTIIDIILNDIHLFTPSPPKKTAFLIGHSRPYHFMYDGMLGLETIFNSEKKINDDIQFYTLENNIFIDAPKVFSRKQSTTIINSKDLTRLEQEGILFIKIGSLFGSGANEPAICKKIKSLDEKIISYSHDVNSHNDDIASDIKKHFPIIWIGVTGQKRAWLEQIEGYSNIINELYKSFPGMAVVFDGWTSSLASLQRDKVESDNDRKITHEISKRIAPDIKTIDLVGATIDKKIYVGSFVDCAIVNYSTGSMNVSRICGRPCITHMNNSFAPARHQHIHKNAHPIPDKYVTDVIEDGSRIDSTNYHINWEHIYDALVSHLGQQNIINNRW